MQCRRGILGPESHTWHDRFSVGRLLLMRNVFQPPEFSPCPFPWEMASKYLQFSFPCVEIKLAVEFEERENCVCGEYPLPRCFYDFMNLVENPVTVKDSGKERQLFLSEALEAAAGLIHLSSHLQMTPFVSATQHAFFLSLYIEPPLPVSS